MSHELILVLFDLIIFLVPGHKAERQPLSLYAKPHMPQELLKPHVVEMTQELQWKLLQLEDTNNQWISLAKWYATAPKKKHLDKNTNRKKIKINAEC